MIQVGIGYFLFAVCSMTQSTEQNCILSASAYWKPCSFHLWIVHSFIPDPVLRAHYTRFSAAAYYYAQSFMLNQLLLSFSTSGAKLAKITYIAIVNLVLSSFAFLLFICFSIDHRSLNFAFLLINNILLPTKNCPSCCGHHKL